MALASQLCTAVFEGDMPLLRRLLGAGASPDVCDYDKRTALQLNTQRIATVFESVIRRYPDQWFNYVPAFPQPSA